MVPSPLGNHFRESRDDIENTLCLRIDLGTVRHNVNGIPHSLAVFFCVVQRRELVHQNDQACGENEVSEGELARLGAEGCISALCFGKDLT